MLVSIVIPCRDTRFFPAGLLEDIQIQKCSFSVETIKITAVSPAGKARNQGAAQARGEFLIFLDCDIRLGQEQFLERLVNALLQDRSAGASCASICLPRQATSFQKRYAAQIAHCESPLVDKVTDVQVASSACFAISRELYEKLGGFNERIPRGEDSVLSEQVHRAGLRTVLVPQAWCTHPVPRSFAQLAAINLRDGLGAAYVDAFFPELNLDVHPLGVDRFSEKKTFGQRVSRFFCQFGRAVCRLQVLLLAAKLFYAFGYLGGWMRYKIFGQKAD